MGEIKIDKRVRKTKKLLLDALTTLMKEKKVNKITVTELTNLADVNRSTFYLYYDDIFDMVDKVESEIMESFSKAFKEFSTQDATYENTLSFFTYVFEFVKDNSGMCEILLGPYGEYSFIEKFKRVLKNSQPNINSKNTEIKNEFFMPFIVSGCIGTIQHWLKDDMKTPISDIAVFVTNMISSPSKLILIDNKKG